MYNGLASRTTALILTLSVILKYVSSVFKLARILIIQLNLKMPYYSRIILTTDHDYSQSIIDTCLVVSAWIRQRGCIR